LSARETPTALLFKPEHGTVGWAGADYGVFGKAVLRAIDYQTGKSAGTMTWEAEGAAAGVLTTDSGVIFTGDSVRSVMALRTSDGATLWHSANRIRGKRSNNLRAGWPAIRNRRQRRNIVRLGLARKIKRPG